MHCVTVCLRTMSVGKGFGLKQAPLNDWQPWSGQGPGVRWQLSGPHTHTLVRSIENSKTAPHARSPNDAVCIVYSQWWMHSMHTQLPNALSPRPGPRRHLEHRWNGFACHWVDVFSEQCFEWTRQEFPPSMVWMWSPHRGAGMEVIAWPHNRRRYLPFSRPGSTLGAFPFSCRIFHNLEAVLPITGKNCTSMCPRRNNVHPWR